MRQIYVNPVTDHTVLKNVNGKSEVAVNETFFSIQGEGKFTGTPAFFIRLQGCLIGCPWCDSKSTWESSIKTVSIAELVRSIPHSARHVVVTGGEPFEQDIKRLLNLLWFGGRSVQVETSGCVDTYGPAHITVSPKFFKPLSKQALRSAAEIKQVVCSQNDINRLMDEVLPHVNQYVPVYLQPVSNGKRAIKICIEACKKHGFLLSLQTHKLINIQ